MNFLKAFLSNFFSAYEITSAEENDIAFSCEISATKLQLRSASEIQSSSGFLQPRDNFILTINFGNADPITLTSIKFEVDLFREKIEKESEFQEGEKIIATFSIDKKKRDNKISIYNLETFSKTLSKLYISQGLAIFARALYKSTYVNFQVFDLTISFNTATIFFTPMGQSPVISPTVNRLKLIDSLRSISYFTEGDGLALAPNDFCVLNQDNSLFILNSLFETYSQTLSIIFLFDITSIVDNSLEFKVNGYKTFSGVVTLNQFERDYSQYYNIYNWVYSGGNLNDKIGLARNIISLHFQDKNSIVLKGEVFESIQSSYKVYERQNIKQYIEIRNKIADQLLDFNTRANKVIESFAFGFQKSALALITFYMSAIVLKVLGKEAFVSVFTLDTMVLSLVFIIISFIYFGVSRWEVKAQRQRFIDSYNNLKERYTDLLDTVDIRKIVNNDKEFNEDIAFIDAKMKMYSLMWILFLTLLFCATLGLFAYSVVLNFTRIVTLEFLT